ncbi:MAG: WecB/TagA/CpsF family glycosyltransferase [Eubacteriaceae bacterium]|nr:WecB/TagA/CpsF family glycosyltransferase [Eubacteriaceae bacterium]
MATKKTSKVLGYDVYSASMESLAKHIASQVEKGSKIAVFALNPNKAVIADSDAELKAALNSAGALIADGVGICLAARAFGAKVERITGIDLMHSLLGVFEAQSSPVLIYGAKEQSLLKAIDQIMAKHPGLQLAGHIDGYSLSEGQADSFINESKAQCIFVALGSPMQEKAIANRIMKLEHVRFAMGVGGSLDVIAGTVKRAPKALRFLGLEWAYRLMQKPSRAKQIHLGKYIKLVIKELRAKNEGKRFGDWLHRPANSSAAGNRRPSGNRLRY